MPDFSKARVGDKVWSKIHGEGEIIDIYGNSYPIVARFRTYGDDAYNSGGFRSKADLFPELLWGPVEFDDPPPPKRKVKKVIDGWTGLSTMPIREGVRDTSCFYNYEIDYDRLIGRFDGFIKIHIHHEYEKEE